jgi:hypothetical protein
MALNKAVASVAVCSDMTLHAFWAVEEVAHFSRKGETVVVGFPIAYCASMSLLAEPKPSESDVVPPRRTYSHACHARTPFHRVSGAMPASTITLLVH